jgi:hypothetical protein
MHHRRSLRRLSVGAVAAVLSLVVWLGTATAQVSPATVVATLAPGQSMTVTKTVPTPFVPATADFYFLADTTGSMGPTIAGVQASASAIMAALAGSGTNSAFAAGDYKDFPSDPYAFNPCSTIPAGGGGQATAQACINGWAASGGFDIAEGQFFALHRIAAHGAAAFRAAATKFVIWFGDAPAHDPVCDAINGAADTHDTTEASLTAELVAAGIKVIAISVTSGPGLNADPNDHDGDYTPPCATENGSANQANRLAAATGGAVLTGVAPGDVADAILDAIAAVQVTVTPQATCNPNLSVSFAPPSQTVNSGSNAVFSETITVSDAALPGVYTCTVQFLINGQPATPPLTQTITITVLNTPCVVKANGQRVDGRTALDALVRFQVGFANPIGAVVHADRATIAGNLSSGTITGLTCVRGVIANIGGLGVTTAGFVPYVLRLEDLPGPFFFYRITWPGYTSSGTMLGSLIIQQAP